MTRRLDSLFDHMWNFGPRTALGPGPGPGQLEIVVVYYCRTYMKAVRGGGSEEWGTCAIECYETRPVSLEGVWKTSQGCRLRLESLCRKLKLPSVQ